MVLLCAGRKRSHRRDDFLAATSGRDWKPFPGPGSRRWKDVDPALPARRRTPSKARRPMLQLGANASQSSAGRLRLRLTTQGRPNALFQPLWGRITERAILESRTQRCLVAIGVRADLAFLHVLLDLQTSGQIQLAINVRVNQPLCYLTTQVKTSVCV